MKNKNNMLAARFLSSIWIPKAGLQVVILASSMAAIGQKRVVCQDGDHILIDFKQISIQYDGSSFAATLSSLSALAGTRLEVEPKKLQEAAVATQQWNEFLKGLVAGYNSCAITRREYADGIARIYPRLKEDGTELEKILKLIETGQKADTRRVNQLTDSFSSNLRQFATVAGEEKILDRIDAVSKQVAGDDLLILQNQQLILNKLDQLDLTREQNPLPTQQQVSQQIDQVSEELRGRATNAEKEYHEAYALLDRYRLAEAVPHLQRALDDVPLPIFYLALGRTYHELSNLKQAETTLREGIKNVSDAKYEALLESQLSLVLSEEGLLTEALQHSKREIELEEKVFGPEDSQTANGLVNIGLILGRLEEYDAALQDAQQGLQIHEKKLGPNDPQVALDLGNVGSLYWDKHDIPNAMLYAQRALELDGRIYGTESPEFARQANNIGTDLRDAGQLGSALPLLKLAFAIDEKLYGPDHPEVAKVGANVGQVLLQMDYLEEASKFLQRALQIDERVYGPDHPEVARCLTGLGEIRRKQGDLSGALQSYQRALDILQRTYGPDNSITQMIRSNVQQIRQALPEHPEIPADH